MHPSHHFLTSRRHWLAWGGALAAVGTGGALLWAHLQSTTSNEEAVQAFWQMELTQADGQALALASFQGKPLLVNFWATWCPPCVRELPLINAFSQARTLQQAHGIQVLGIAVDQAVAVHRWLARQPLDYPVGLLQAGGVGLTRSLGNISGGLPFTILFDAQGRIQQRKIGELSQQDLEHWAALVT